MPDLHAHTWILLPMLDEITLYYVTLLPVVWQSWRFQSQQPMPRMSNGYTSVSQAQIFVGIWTRFQAHYFCIKTWPPASSG
jgi:hypothetical protein